MPTCHMSGPSGWELSRGSNTSRRATYGNKLIFSTFQLRKFLDIEDKRTIQCKSFVIGNRIWLSRSFICSWILRILLPLRSAGKSSLWMSSWGFERILVPMHSEVLSVLKRKETYLNRFLCWKEGTIQILMKR